MLRAGFITALLAAGACGTGDVTGPDAAPDRDADEIPGDGPPPGDGGLLFALELKPSLPGDIGGGIEGKVEKVRVVLEDVRAIGEAAPGDERTTEDLADLRWEKDNEEEIFFPEAPVGMYARFLGEAISFEVEGTVEVNDDDMSFEVEIEAPRSISVDITGVEVLPGETTMVEIEVDVRDALRLVDWESVEVEEDGLVVDDDSPFYDDIVDALVDSFEPKLGGGNDDDG